MARYGFLCLLMAALACGGSASAQQTEPAQPPAGTKAAPATDWKPAAPVPPDAPVITIQGLCDHPSSGASAASDCKTVVKRAEFERVVELTHPQSPSSAYKFFAVQYVRSLILAGRAEEMGLDKNPLFAVRMEIPHMTLGRNALEQKFDAEASAAVTDKDMENYYRDHTIEFMEVDVDRIFVPKMPREEDSDPKLSAAEQQKRKQEWLEELRQEAEKLRVRALAGEDFLKLQVEAMIFAGLHDKDADPAMISLPKMRRSMFSSGQRPVMDVKIGEFSPVLSDNNGYSIFRVKGRDTLPFENERVKREIRGILKGEYSKHQMDLVLNSVATTYDASYFGPEPDKESSPSPSGAAATEKHP